MKTSSWVKGAALLSSLLSMPGCGAGTYQIPNVDPVVKQKPEEDELEAELAGDEPATKPAETKPAEAKPAEKPAETKPTETKPAETKPAETAPKTDAKAAAGKHTDKK